MHRKQLHACGPQIFIDIYSSATLLQWVLETHYSQVFLHHCSQFSPDFSTSWITHMVGLIGDQLYVHQPSQFDTFRVSRRKSQLSIWQELIYVHMYKQTKNFCVVHKNQRCYTLKQRCQHLETRVSETVIVISR